MTVEERRRRRFSEEFRKDQVSLFEKGELTIAEICRLYEVKYDTVKRWILKYGRKARPQTIHISSSKEVNRVKSLEKELSQLKQLFGEQQIELLYKNKLLELAKEQLGEDFEKMLIPLLASIKLEIDKYPFSMERIYSYAGITRQGYFQAYKRKNAEDQMMIEIEKKVEDYRTYKDRRAGSRSLYYNLEIKRDYGIGVTKFEELMSIYGLTLQPLHVRIVTTKSSLQSWNYEDLTAGISVNNINQLVVGDLTYVIIGKELFYLFCLTDVYSARMVGYHMANRMRSKEAKLCFDKWCELRSVESLGKCIHHTDGGSQYFSKLYIEAGLTIGLRISVSKNCLDNAYAEQRNGLIKHHLIPTIQLKKRGGIMKKMDQLIYFYNYERKQKDLGWLSPVEYEEKWSGSDTRPILKIYDRDQKERSKRNGF